jgi:HEAT repeat protein
MMTTILFIALQTVLIAGSGPAHVSGQFPDGLNLGAQSQDSSDAAMKAFSDARNLIKDGEWAKAEQSFNSFITSYPKDKDIAAAHYWLAFALKQQNQFQEADKWLLQLIEKFPGSSWVTDARTMRVEIAPRLNNKIVIEQGVSAENEEIKLAALQSLFEAKPERAIALAAEILKTGSGASRLMKEGAIALLTDADSKQAIPVLIEAARGETDYELRKKAVRALGIHDDESVLDPLKALVTQSADKEIARIAVRALAEHEGPRAQALLIEIARSNADAELRATAIKGLGEREQDSVVDELLKLFTSDRNETIRKEILSALAEIKLPRAQAAILEVARAADSVELRKRAIRALGDREEEQAVDSLIQLYDAEKDEGMKEVILNALGDSEQTKSLMKLMDVVRREPSLKLKKKALAMIGESDDPEAAKFLEELLKKN